LRGYYAVEVQTGLDPLFPDISKQNEEELSKASSKQTREEEEEEFYFLIT